MRTLLLLACFLWLASTLQAGVVQRRIYAGDTPLASTCAASLTGPLQITIPACSFTTTGEARIREYRFSIPDNMQQRINAGKAEIITNGLIHKRVRVWLEKQDGTLQERSRTVTTSTDTVLSITMPLVDTYYRVGLGVNSGVASILLQSSADKRVWAPAPPAGWRLVHLLIFPFLVPAGDLDLSDNTIQMFTVLPGFPSGTGPEDFKVLIGP